MASDDDKPLYLQMRKGRWFWEPPTRIRKTHKMKSVALGADQSAAWAAARKLTAEMLNTPAGAAAAGTVAWVFEQFFLTKEFLGLAHYTKRDYKGLARRLSRAPGGGNRTLGEVNARSIRPRHADLIYAHIYDESSHHTAHYCVRFARRVWQWAGRAEHVDMLNPWKDMRIESLPERDQVWTPAQVAAVIAKATEMGKGSIALAVEVAYAFSHRRGDVLSLTWDMLDDEERKTSKTKVTLPMVRSSYPELDAALKAERDRQKASGKQAESKDKYVIECELTGKNWHPDVFSHHFRTVARAAGIPDDLQYRDIRATAVTELGDAGASIIDMSTHTGHKTAAMARRYARPTAEQFQHAAEKRTNHKNKTKTIDGTADGTTERLNFERKKP